MTGVWWKDLVPMAFAVGSVVTFGLALVRKRFEWPDFSDWTIVALDTAITIWWCSVGSATGANLFYQVSTVMAFVPMYRGLLRGTEEERPLPWALWSMSFAFFLLSASLFSPRWEEWAFPVVGLGTHMAVFVIALRKARRT
jgi:hypothetical protein